MIADISQETGHSIRRVSEVLELSRSSFYHAAKPTPTQEEDAALGSQIEAVFKHHQGRYGYRLIQVELKEQGLVTCKPRKFTPRTSDGRADAPSPNRISGKPPLAINEICVGDITYLHTDSGWHYMAVVMDLYSRRIVGWSMAYHMRADLVCDAMKMALSTRQNTQGVIFHSDRGSQYDSRQFRALLKNANMLQSMSARANPYDNAWTESFIGTLKNEMGDLLGNLSPHQTRLNCFLHIEGYYNTHRRHSALGYLSPSNFEANYALN